MDLCFQENLDGTIRASYIREMLEEAWLNLGVWDTALWVKTFIQRDLQFV